MQDPSGPAVAPSLQLGGAASSASAPSSKPTVGLHQIGISHKDSYDRAQSLVRQMVLRSLNTGRTIGFVGSGLSQPLGFPSWSGMLRGVRAGLALDYPGAVEPQQGQALASIPVRDLLDELAYFDQTLIASKAQSHRPGEEGTAVQRQVCRILSEISSRYREQKDAPKLQPEPSPQPFRDGCATIRALHETLGIRRYITTNYDPVLSTELGIEGHRRLIASAENLGRLWQFAVDAGDKSATVFHCHGHADAPGSLIVVEPHYRRVYLGDSWEAKCYRRVLELIFDANPILFVGSGVAEEDVLRHLRAYLARESFVRRDRPVFALSPRWKFADEGYDGDAHFLGLMRDRQSTYNIKTLFYDTNLVCEVDEEPDWESPGTQAQVAASLLACLKSMGAQWSDWSNDYQYKPSTRPVQFRRHAVGSGPEVVIRHSIAQDDFHRWVPVRAGVDSKVPFAPGDHAKLCAELERESGLVVVLGRRGTSKGTIGEWLVKEWGLAVSGAPAAPGFEKRIFVSAHFSNDLSTLITGIVRELEGPAADTKQALTTRLKACLQGRRALVVIGGFERLLQPLPGSRVTQVLAAIDGAGVRDHPIGAAATGEVQALLNVLGELAVSGSRPAMQSTVVITTSMVPADWLERNTAARPRIVELEGLSDADIKAWFGEAECSDELEKLVHAVRGHAYGMSVARCVARAGWPGAQDSASIDKRWVRDVLRDLRNTSMDRRLEQLLRKTLDRLTTAGSSNPGTSWRAGSSLLQASACFTVPVSAEELLVAAGAIAETMPESGADKTPATREDLDWLARNKLLLKVSGGSAGGEVRYTAHSSMRACALQLLGSVHSASGEPHALALEGFAKRLSEAHGGTARSESIADQVFERLFEDAVQEESARARPLLQGAAALLRGRWTTTGIGHRDGEHAASWSLGGRARADSYHYKLVRLLNAIRELSESWYDYRVDNQWIYDERAILYADELSWIYNEIGLVWFVQGALEDAGVAFRLGHDVNVVCEGRRGGPRWCQAEINLALVQIERGYIKRARAHLENVLRHCQPQDDPDLYGRVLGFLGLVMHLRGDGEAAGQYYEESIGYSHRVGNQRALSIFQRHKGDLDRKRGDIDRAWKCIRESIAAAEAGQDMDLFAYARVAEENLILRERTAQGSSYECRLGDVRSMSQELGLPKLEAEACLVEGYGALSMGDLERAMELAVYCMGVCGGLGMRLRLSSAQVLLGRVLIRQHDRKAAQRVLAAVVETGRKFGYQTKIEEASGLLLELRAHP